MGREMYPALSGGLRAMRSLDLIANNLANVNTTGFKADRAQFQLEAAEGVTPNAAAVSLAEGFVTSLGETTDYSQGVLRETANPTDLALRGERGFFVLGPGDGSSPPMLTRDGSFYLDPEGFLSAGEGLRVLSDTGKPIKVAGGGPVVVGHDGAVTVGGVAAGKVGVMDVADRALLAKSGGNRWATGGAELEPVAAEVVQGYLESSNVEPVPALTELIAVTRYYEAFQKNLDASSKLDEALASQVGRLDR